MRLHPLVRSKSTGLWAWSVSLFGRRAGFFVPACAAQTPPRAVGVKAGRRSDLAKYTDIARPRLDVHEHGGRLGAVGRQRATSEIGIGLAINSAEEFRSPYIRSALTRAQPISRMRGKGSEAGADGTNLWTGLEPWDMRRSHVHPGSPCAAL